MPPDIVLLGVDWQARALLRAQLIEEGFDVVATDDWAAMRRQLRPGAKPRQAIVDLKSLPNPRQVLDDLRVLMKPDRVLVIGAIGTGEAQEIAHLRFRAVSRPIVIDDLVKAIRQAIG
jgi:hypothetical protein